MRLIFPLLAGLLTTPALGYAAELTTLATFDGSNGANPYAGLTRDADGNLYGTTQYGGSSNSGTIFELVKGSRAVTTLASFNGANGARPLAGVTMDGSGNLFGTASGGGAGYGTVFELAQGSTNITPLASFGSSNSMPSGRVAMDSNGNLFGTTAGGSGTVFELARSSSTITTLASFNSTNGAYPYGGVIMDAGGNLFGAAQSGGPSSGGTVFKVAQGSNAITTLASFNFLNGAWPFAGVIADADGNLFGTTSIGGPSNSGTVFELPNGSSAITTLASFNGTDGSGPRASLTMDADGNLFGTTLQGGSGGYGTVFELAKGSNAITTLVSFDNTNGASPYGSLIMDADGNLFGTTYGDGVTNFGTVFEVSMSSTSVPEPPSGALLALGVTVIPLLRRRRDSSPL